MGKHLVWVGIQDETLEELLNDADEIMKRIDGFTCKWRRLLLSEAKKEEAASGD